MSQPIAFLDGKLVPQSDLAIDVNDTGFLLGTAVSERLRTFGGRLFRLPQHLDRLADSLRIVDLEDALDRATLTEAAESVVESNYALIDPRDDLGLSLFVTPGVDSGRPTICLHTAPLPFHHWAVKYRTGESLVISQIRQVPPNCWPAELKCRSRMHYYLADRDARRADSGARALLLDQEGFVSEASTANVLMFNDSEGLVSPRRDKVLPGISLAVIESLAADMSVNLNERDILPAELVEADEVLMCSTSPCVWSVTQIDRTPIGNGEPGPFAKKLLDAWSRSVGFSIDEQALRHA